MITENAALKLIEQKATLRDWDGEVGTVTDIDSDGETVIVLLEAVGFRRWADILDVTEVAKCGRCNKHVPADTIQQTGPYRTCTPCAAIIRN